MLGQPSWFQRRKYGGWGISPRTWQGWVYLGAILLPFIIFHALPYWSTETRLLVTGLWAAILLVDVTHIMLALRRDEREAKIEALAERNAAWFMAITLALGLAWQLISSALEGAVAIDWWLAAALFGGALVKTLSNLLYGGTI